MRRYLLALLAAVLLVPFVQVAAAPAASAAEPRPATVHPRLLFSAGDVPALRARVGVPGSVHAAAYSRLLASANRFLVEIQPDVVRSNACLPQEPIFHTSYQGFECPYNLQGEMPTVLMELGLAYQLSGDERYGRRVIDLLIALGDASYPYWTEIQDLGIGDLLEGIGLGFDWTYQLMTDEERQTIVDQLTAHQDMLFVRPLFEYTNEASTYPASNWMGVTAGGAGLTLLAIRGEQGAPTTYTSPPNAAFANIPAWPATTYTYDQYLDKAMLQVRTYFRGGIDPSGASQEGHTYAEYGLRNTIPFALAARRDGLGDAMDPATLPSTHCWGGTQYFCLPLGDGTSRTGIRGLSRWLSMEQLPGEGQNYVPLGDSQRDEVGVDLQAQLFAINPDDRVAQWFWRRTVGDLGTNFYGNPNPANDVRDDKCRNPLETLSFLSCDIFSMQGDAWTILFYRTPAETPEVDPAATGPLSVLHAERGLVDARTGFARGTHEVISTFEARRNGIAHFQYDIGNFTLYGEGGRFAVDPGFDCVACDDRPTYGELNHPGGYADEHNVVVIDGQTRTQVSDSRYAMVRGTPIDRFLNAPNLSLAHADTRYAYGRDGSGAFFAPYAGRDQLFLRAPGRPVILGISDHMQRDASGTHAYRWQLITNNDNIVTPSGTGFTIQHGLAGATLVGRVAAGGSAATDLPIQLSALPVRTSGDDEGKIYPVVYTETPKQVAMDQLAVMALTPAGEAPAVTETLRVQGGNAIGVTWKGVQDVIVRKLRGAAQVAPLTDLTPGIETDASIAKFTRDDASIAGGSAAETVMRDGKRLTAFGRSYVTVTGSNATVTVSGAEVAATGATSNAYRVFAPQPISKVIVNGAPAYSCRDGEYLTFPCLRATTVTLSAPASAPATDRASFTATLTSAGAPVAGQPVRFTVGGLTADAVTDASGVARADVTLDLDAGTYTVQASYAGGEGYAPSSASQQIQVTPDTTTLTYTGDTQGRGETVNVSAVLTEDGGVPMPGRPVGFTLEGQTVVVTTDANGRAAATMSAPDHGRSQSVSVSFAGAPQYAPAVTSATVIWGLG